MTKPKTKPKKKMGRPRIEFDLDELEKLGSIHATDMEIASWFNTTTETIRKRKNDDPDFLGAYEKGRGSGKMSLRRAQMKAALSGNVTMMIWLGKQYLTQSDRQDLALTGADGGPVQEVVKVEIIMPKDEE